MKILATISSFLLMGSLAAVDSTVQYVSLEAPTLTADKATLRVVVRGEDRKPSPVSEPMVIDLMPIGSRKPLATVVIKRGQSSADVKLSGKAVIAEIERGSIHGHIRAGDTGFHAGKITPNPTAVSAVN